MKLIIAIVQPSRLEAVKEALTEVEVFRLTVVDCQGFGRQKGQSASYRGPEFATNLLRKVQLQIAVNEQFVEPTIQAILKEPKAQKKGRLATAKFLYCHSRTVFVFELANVGKKRSRVSSSHVLRLSP